MTNISGDDAAGTDGWDEAEEPGLVRYWFEFDVPHLEPGHFDGVVRVDGCTAACRLLGRGAGVTGYTKADCLNLLARALGEALPPVTAAVRNPVISPAQARAVGNPAWRGVWLPYLNIRGPVLD